MTAPSQEMDCRVCRYFEPLINTGGQCRRYAPRPGRSHETDDGDYLPHHADWPRVEHDDWCGEFAPWTEK